MAAYEQKELEFFGKKYKFQRIPNYPWLKARSKFLKSSGEMDLPELYKYLAENVIISPKIDLDEGFEYASDMDEVMMAAFNFQQSRPK